MARINVEFTTSVTVVVDTETRKIEQVVVDDENIRLLENHAHGPAFDNAGNVTPEAIAEAVEIVQDGDIEWPAWDFGW